MWVVVLFVVHMFDVMLQSVRAASFLLVRSRSMFPVVSRLSPLEVQDSFVVLLWPLQCRRRRGSALAYIIPLQCVHSHEPIQEKRYQLHAPATSVMSSGAAVTVNVPEKGGGTDATARAQPR